MQRIDQTVNEVPIVLQERTVPPALRYVLRTSQVEIDGVAVFFYHPCRGEKFFRVVGAELHDQRSIRFGIAFFAGDEVEV
jgi:hypothetical protein